MKNLIGTTIHQYQILVKIRETGTRILYKAYDARTHQHVGLEVLEIHCVGVDLNDRAKDESQDQRGQFKIELPLPIAQKTQKEKHPTSKTLLFTVYAPIMQKRIVIG